MASITDVNLVNILVDDFSFSENWKMFCVRLGLRQKYINDLQRKLNSNEPMTNIIMEIMSIWTSTSPKDATPNMLSQKLREHDCVKLADDVDAYFANAVGTSGSSGTTTVKNATDLITKNFEFLVKHLTDTLSVVIALVSGGVITIAEKDEVMSHKTENKKSNELFTILSRKNLDANGLKMLISILENTGNLQLVTILK